MDTAHPDAAITDILPGLVVRLEGQRIREVLDSLPAEQALPTVHFEAHHLVFEEGQQGDRAYLLLEGTVLIEKQDRRGRVRQLARLQEGDVFGEMALLDTPQRSATARVGAEGARMLEISRDAMGRIFLELPRVALWLLKVLSHRLRLATKMISEMEQVQQVNRRIIEGQDQERRRIARDLHDGPCQQYAAYIMRLQIIEKLLDRNLDQARQEVVDLRGSLGEGLDALRKLMHNLHNKACETSGLEVAIRKFLERLGSGDGFQVEVAMDPELTARLPNFLETTLYCLVQEAMNNIRKHAAAEQVVVRLRPGDPGRCVLEVEDDGKGFDVPALFASYHERESLGMTSMKERAELAGGRMQIRSQVGQGTLVHFDFPLAGGDETVTSGEENS